MTPGKQASQSGIEQGNAKESVHHWKFVRTPDVQISQGWEPCVRRLLFPYLRCVPSIPPVCAGLEGAGGTGP